MFEGRIDKRTEHHGQPLPRRVRARRFIHWIDGRGLMSMCRARTVVLVEDDPIIRDVLGGMLECFEWLVTTVASAEDALSLLDTAAAPAVLITDVNLGLGMNGFEFCAIAQRRWPEVGIVVISGRPACANQLDTLRPQDIFLSKPITLSALEAALARICNPI
jgi:CheY-like chemotaxis protein